MKQEGRAGENTKIEGFWILSALLNQHLSTEVARITVQCQMHARSRNSFKCHRWRITDIIDRT